VVRTERWLDSENRADIQVVGRRFVIQIEAKIDAPISEDQLQRYHALLVSHYPNFIRRELLLSRYSNPALKLDYDLQCTTWDKVAEALRLFGGEGEQKALSSKVRLLARQYADYIEDEIASK